MVVWGGQFYDTAFDEYHPIGDGGRYDPATDTWTPTSATNAPAARSWHTAVWSGQEMVVWGGVGTQLLDDGGRYDPMSDAWTPTGNVGAPTPRFAHTGVWTGTQLIVWGGRGVSSYLDSGGRYDPAADTWAPLSENNSPVGRYRHTAVWTGSEMIVWGGLDGQGVSATGGRYDPTTDAWVATSLSGSPSGRLNHTAVWTGSNMIIWAGFDGADELTGGAYHPPTDMWTPLSTTDAPTNGQGHTAIWTGRHMVVWGGSQRGTFTLLNTGSRYDPASDTWTRTTADNAPMGRVGHVAVWSGEFMIVWGGEDALSTKTGGAYCACVPTLHYRDADGDGRGDPEAFVQSCSQPEGHVTDGNDCDDGAADVWAAPGEVRDLLFVDGVTLGWKTPADPGATLIGYDVIRSDDPADFMSGAVCIATDVMTVTAADASSPVQGKALFYLVRAETGCPDGQGTLGTDSSGTPRSGRSCP
jgi:N-acetylneuraminic acid mutarotase